MTTPNSTTRSAPKRKRRPPYAGRLKPGTRDVHAFVDNWTDAKAAAATRSVVLLPPDAEPEHFDWSACAGADVLLRWRATETTRQRVHRLALELVRAGAALVLSCETTGAPTDPMSAYRQQQQGVQDAA